MARHHVMLSGLLGPVTRTLAPARVTGIPQCGGEVIPAACPHCYAAGVAWVVNERMGFCRTCGADFYKTRYTVTPPYSRHRGNPQPHPLAPR